MAADGVERRGLMFVLSSPSGAGKTTLARELMNKVPGLQMSVSVTTRPMRPGEIEGNVDRLIPRGGDVRLDTSAFPITASDRAHRASIREVDDESLIDPFDAGDMSGFHNTTTVVLARSSMTIMRAKMLESPRRSVRRSMSTSTRPSR